MSRSRSPSNTSSVASALALVLAAYSCGQNHAAPDAFCGTGGAGAATLVATASGATMTYGRLRAGANNDCPDAGAPMGVVSLTIAGVQTDGTGLFTICVPRPDLLASQTLALGTQVTLVDETATAASCTYKVDRATMPTGTISATGECGNGIAPAGFALTVAATVALKRTCGATIDSVSATLAGTVAVAAQ